MHLRRRHIPFVLLFAIAGFFIYLVPAFNRFDSSTRVVSIGYHSDACEECNTLKDKMKRMNLRYGWAAIVFVKYDQTTSATAAKAEAKLKKMGFYETAQADKGLRYVRLYDRSTQAQLAQINWDDTPDAIAEKIEQALKRTRKP